VTDRQTFFTNSSPIEKSKHPPYYSRKDKRLEVRINYIKQDLILNALTTVVQIFNSPSWFFGGEKYFDGTTHATEQGCTCGTIEILFFFKPSMTES